MGNELTKAGNTSLAVVSEPALELLPPEERKIIEAALAPRIDVQPTMQVVAEMVTILTTIYTIAGQKADAGTLAIYADEFYQKVKQVYPFITCEEIKTALRNGVYDEYGEYYGLNPKTLMQFVACYVKSEQRALAAERFNKAKALLAEPKISQEDQDRENVVYTNELYSRYLAGDLDIDFLPSFIYDFLLRKNLLSDQLNCAAASVYYSQNARLIKVKWHSKAWTEAWQKEKAAAVNIVAKQMAVFDYFALCKAHKKETIL